MDVIEEEATSDYSGLAGVNVDEAHQGVWAGIVNRLPGIVTLLIMGTVTAVLFRHYEPIIQQASIFAIFITLIDRYCRKLQGRNHLPLRFVRLVFTKRSSLSGKYSCKRGQQALVSG